MKRIIVFTLCLLTPGCASGPFKADHDFYKVQRLVVVPPVIELEEFPTASALQTETENSRLRAAMVDKLYYRLRKSFQVQFIPEKSADLTPETQSRIKKLFSDLHDAKALSAVLVNKHLKPFLLEQPEADVVIAYYRGFRRTKESLASGHHSLAYQADVPRSTPRIVNTPEYFCETTPPRYYAENPEEYSATLMIALIRIPDAQPVYFDMSHENENPVSLKVAEELADRAAGDLAKRRTENLGQDGLEVRGPAR
jgi:hypothetical protein